MTELIQVVGQVQDLIALVQDPFCLGQLCHLADLLAAGIVDIGLVFLHPFRVLLQGGALGYFGGGEQNQVFQDGAVCAGGDAELDLGAEGVPEGVVLLAVVLLDAHQLVLDLLFQVPADDLEDTGLLEHFTTDVQVHVGGIHDTADETEVLGDQVFALVHNHNAGGIQTQAALGLTGIKFLGGGFGDEHEGGVGDIAFCGHAHGGQGLAGGAEVLLIELGVFLFLHVFLGTVPQGDHGVQDFPFLIALPALLFAFGGVGVLFLHPGLFHQAFDGVTDIVGIALDQVLDHVALQVLVIALFLSVRLDVQDDVGAHRVTGGLLDGEAVYAVGIPPIGLVTAIGTGDDGDVVGPP